MPVQILDNRPSYVTNPDLRYGVTFLDSNYRDFAINGEVLIDKRTGELFLKRKEDGKVVSFHQNKKETYDNMLELRVLLTNNENYTYPLNVDTAFYASVDYDVVTINDEKPINVKSDVLTIANDDIPYHNVKFTVSGACNGFFMKLTSRDTDKPIIEYITGKYNEFLKSYSGGDASLQAEKGKINTIPLWYDSNATLKYQITVTKGSTTKIYECVDYIRFNESTCVLFPLVDIDVDFPLGYEKVDVVIKEVSFEKLQFTLENKDKFTNISNETLNKLSEVDNEIRFQNFEIIYFIDGDDTINIYGNEFLTSMLSMPYVRRYMSKMAKLKNSSEFVQSIIRPSEMEWDANTIWAERVSDIGANGNVVVRGSETDPIVFEKLISPPHAGNRISGLVVTDETDEENFYSNENYSI